LATWGTRHRAITNKTGQSRDIDNTGHKIHNDHKQDWTIHRRRQHWAQDTFITITNKTGQSRDISNTGHKTQNDHKQDWTIQRHWQHGAQDTERSQTRLDNPETLVTRGTRHRTITNKTGQSRDIGNTGHKTQNDHKQDWTIQRHRQHWAQDTERSRTERLDNPETFATLGTRHRTITNKTGQSIDIGNTGHKIQNDHKQDWKIQRHRQHWTQDTTQNDHKQDWTIQRHWEHWSQDTERSQTILDNP